MVIRCMRDEDGMATVWMLGLATITMVLVALVTDGARVLSAVSETGDTARAAARAGALAVDPATRAMNPSLAAGEARDVVAARQMTPGPIVVATDGTSISVTVETTVDLPLLALLGVRSRTVSASATSDLLQGVSSP
ncbi:hypothetical protein [Nitriliruptor alkaliphilus]|uniref:hypothetical protein n=1 Tax=Nitriliruptor alkaliphilus TaxID=427918 RepID=UPI0012ED6CAD|nr:hypothetical protein [Nitriliruptor alkaliphilus]